LSPRPDQQVVDFVAGENRTALMSTCRYEKNYTEVADRYGCLAGRMFA